MWTHLMAQIATEENLYQAWRKVRSNKGSAGVDTVSIQAFETKLGEHLADLRRRLQEDTYYPLSLRRTTAPKRGGGRRGLAIPTVADRVVQRAFVHVLEPLFEEVFLDCSYGYRPGRSVEQAVQAVLHHRKAGYGWILDADIEHFFDSVNHTLLMDLLRGFEGAAANICLHVFAQSLKHDLSFSGRRERPARDPINAMLNLGYTLLYNNMFAALNIVGLDPYMGFFHQPKHGHAALVSDLIEEFRPVIVDTLVVLMVNHKEVTVEDFQRQSKGEMRFTDHALRRFLDRYDRRLNTQVFYPPMKARFTYRQIFELQARQFAHLVMGAEKEYTPYLWDW